MSEYSLKAMKLIDQKLVGLVGPSLSRTTWDQIVQTGCYRSARSNAGFGLGTMFG